MTEITVNKNRVSHVRAVAVFAMLTISIIPIATINFFGRGLLLYTSIPLFMFSLILVLKNSSITITKRQKSILPLFIYELIALIWSPAFSLDMTSQLLKIIILVLCLILNEFSKDESKFLILGSLIACAEICYCMVSGKAGIDLITGRATMSVFGVMQDPNYLNYAFFFPLAYLLKNTLHNRSMIIKVIGFVSILTIFYSVLLTGSRAGLLSCISIVCFYVLVSYGKSCRFITVVIAIYCICIFTFPRIVSLVPTDILQRFNVSNMLNSDVGKRAYIWQETINELIRSPFGLIFGYGTGSSVYYIGAATHNYYLQVLFENGLIGVLLVFNFYKYVVKRLYGSRNFVGLSCIVGSLIMSFTLSVNTNYFFWASISLCIASNQYFKEGVEEYKSTHKIGGFRICHSSYDYSDKH